jgi:hypothetical protein
MVYSNGRFTFSFHGGVDTKGWSTRQGTPKRQVELSSPLLLLGIYTAYEYLEHDLTFTRLRPSCGRRAGTLD